VKTHYKFVIETYFLDILPTVFSKSNN